MAFSSLEHSLLFCGHFGLVLGNLKGGVRNIFVSLINTQGNPISGYRRLRDFGGKQMTSSSDRVCTYPFFDRLYLNHLIKKLSCSSCRHNNEYVKANIFFFLSFFVEVKTAFEPR